MSSASCRADEDAQTAARTLPECPLLEERGGALKPPDENTNIGSGFYFFLVLHELT